MNGILLVDKPEGISSNKVLTRLKYGGFDVKKLGHGGTLDPAATGLLVVLLGRAVKLSDFIIGHDKTYRVTGYLGQSRDTFDSEGKITGECDKIITRDQVQTVVDEFPTAYDQMPPAYSAIKIKGMTAYKHMREGLEPELKHRWVEIKKLELLDFNYPRFELFSEVSSGTYIRSLIVDIAEKLGTLAYVEKLRRLSSGKFSIDQAAPLDEILTWQPEVLWQRVLPMELAVDHLPAVELTAEQGKTWANGRWLPIRKISNELNPDLDVKPLKSIDEQKTLLRVRVEGELIALGYFDKGFLIPEKVLLR
jgi:tRNA pseudouridine55 synthase